MVCQYLFRKWLGALKQQAITWANVDPHLCRHMVSLGHNKLKLLLLKSLQYILGTGEQYMESIGALYPQRPAKWDANNKRNMKYSRYWSFLRESTGLHKRQMGTQLSSQTAGMYSPHKGQLIRRSFPCHDDIAQAVCRKRRFSTWMKLVDNMRTIPRDFPQW